MIGVINRKNPRRLQKKLSKSVLIELPRGYRIKFVDQFVKILPFALIVLLKKLISNSEISFTVESVSFMTRANRSARVGQIHSAKKFSKVALFLLGKEIEASNRKKILEEIYNFLENRDNHEKCSDELFNVTKCLVNSSELSSQTWYFLSKLMNMFGFLRAGFICRNASISRRLELSNGRIESNKEVEVTYRAFLEQNKLEQARLFLKKEGYRTRGNYQEIALLYLSMIEDPNDKTLLNSNPLRIDENFFNLVNRKTVALVGTGELDHDYGKEIDSAEVVIRLKFTGRNLLSEIREGGRCDVAQYNNLIAQRKVLAETGSFSEVAGLAHIIDMAPGPNQRQDFAGIRVSNCPHYRLAYPEDDLTSGIRALIHISFSGPKSLKLFGFNFFSEAREYSRTMTNYYESMGWRIGDPTRLAGDISANFFSRTEGHFIHDQLSSFCLAQNLYLAGCFSMDRKGTEILSLKPFEYVERVERLLRSMFASNRVEISRNRAVRGA